MNELINNFKYVFLKQYANFKGRADRTEYWLFQAALYFVMTAVYIVVYPFLIMSSFMSSASNAASGGNPMMAMAGVFAMYGIILLVMLVFMLPSWAASVRRLHDINRSGWYLLLSLIPVLGGLVLTIMMCIDGDRGPNKYGDDPKIKRYQDEQCKS